MKSLQHVVLSDSVELQLAMKWRSRQHDEIH